MKRSGTESTPRRRRRDREPLTDFVDTAVIAPNATNDIGNAVQHLANEPTHDDIALRAHQLFEDRGREHGDDLKDWLQAERELRDQAVVGVVGRIVAIGGPYGAV